MSNGPLSLSVQSIQTGARSQDDGDDLILSLFFPQCQASIHPTISSERLTFPIRKGYLFASVSLESDFVPVRLFSETSLLGSSGAAKIISSLSPSEMATTNASIWAKKTNINWCSNSNNNQLDIFMAFNTAEGGGFVALLSRISGDGDGQSREERPRLR